MKIVLPTAFFAILLIFPHAYATDYGQLHLDDISNITRENSIITFSGTLESQDGTPLANRTIFIEDDTAYIRPDIILAIAVTDSDGKFSTTWQAVPKDNEKPFHFYAKFIGGKMYGYTRSESWESNVVLNQSSNHNTVPSDSIPAWFRDASLSWHDNKIRDVDYAYAIGNLIDYDIIKSENTPSSLHFPPWMKNDVNWWNKQLISDGDFTKSLEFMINKA